MLYGCIERRDLYPVACLETYVHRISRKKISRFCQPQTAKKNSRLTAKISRILRFAQMKNLADNLHVRIAKRVTERTLKSKDCAQSARAQRSSQSVTFWIFGLMHSHRSIADHSQRCQSKGRIFHSHPPTPCYEPSQISLAMKSG